MEWEAAVRERSELGCLFIGREGGVGGVHGQREGARAVALANGRPGLSSGMT
jgi:hypothetical protein